MNLLENDATASLTDREKTLLRLLGQCRSYLADLRGGDWIKGNNDAAKDMRQRAEGLQRAAGAWLLYDPVLHKALYGGE